MINHLHKTAYKIIVLLFCTLTITCTKKGLITDNYPKEFYSIPKLLPEQTSTTNPTFIIYSDNQSGWYAKEKFLRKSNWITWKMLLFPFYECYLLGNGIYGGINWLRQNPDYGTDSRLMVRDAIYAEAKQLSVDFIINVGDINAHDGRYPAHWELFLKENKINHPLVNEIPYLPVIGNHEHANDEKYGFPNFQAIFNYPRFYVIEYASVVFIILDSNFILDQYRNIDNDLQDKLFEKWFVSRNNVEEPAWLEKQLLKYKSTSFKIILMHHPLISFGYHHNDWFNTRNGNNLLDKREKLLNLFKKNKVQLVFSGHDHLYQHNILKYDQDSQIHFLVGGGGGVPVRDLPSQRRINKFHQNFKKAKLNISIAKHEKIHHYYLTEVDSNNIKIKVIEVTRQKESPIRIAEEILLTN